MAKHSYVFIKNMIEGLIHNDCKIIAIVSKNMPEIDKWKNIEGIKIYEVDGYTNIRTFPLKLIKYYLKDAPRIKKLVKKLNINGEYIPICSYWSWVIHLSLPPVKLVYAMHDPVSHNRKITPIRVFNYLIARQADYIVILSDIFRQHVKDFYRKRDNQIVMIPSGYENVAISGTQTQIVVYDENKINFLFQGRIDKYKGLDILAKAYEKLRKKYDDVSLTIAGSGDFSLYEPLYKYLEDCTIINRWLTDEEVTSLFNDRNVITVLPYTSATQSGVINVALPNGSPIIASRCGGIEEQIVDGVTGYLFEPNNIDELLKKMEYVILHKNELEEIRRNGYKKMKSLDWDILSKKLADIF